MRAKERIEKLKWILQQLNDMGYVATTFPENPLSGVKREIEIEIDRLKLLAYDDLLQQIERMNQGGTG